MSIRVFLLTLLVSAFILPKALEGIQLILVYVSLVSCWIHPLHRHSSRQSLVYVKNTFFWLIWICTIFLYMDWDLNNVCSNIQSEVLPSCVADSLCFTIVPRQLDGSLDSSLACLTHDLLELEAHPFFCFEHAINGLANRIAMFHPEGDFLKKRYHGEMTSNLEGCKYPPKGNISRIMPPPCT